MGQGRAEQMSALSLDAGYTEPGAAGPCGAPKGTPPQSRSSDTKLLVILHRLQAASHLGDFVPTSPLPGWHSLPWSRLTPPHPGPGRGDPDTLASPASPPGSVTGLNAPGRCHAPRRT